MTIRTVFFDMGGTIDTFWYSPQMRLQVTPQLLELMSSYGINLPFSSDQLYKMITSGLARYHEWRLASLDELPASTVWRDYILAGCSADFPQLTSTGDDLMVWLETHYYRRQMRPEIPAVLDSIHSLGYKIGLISNVNSRGQVPLNLSQYGIKHYFNPIVLSSEYSRRKPDPSIFHYAARLSETPTSECIYIGDRISRDVLGAKRAGFKLALQIRHDFNHGENDEGATPDGILNDMTELLEILNTKNITTRQGLPENKIRGVLFDADGVLYYRKDKDQEFNSFIRMHAKHESKISENEINELRHQAFIGQISFEKYKTAMLNLHGITDPQTVSAGIRCALIEKDKIEFFNDTLDTLNQLKNRNLYLGIVTDTAQPLHLKLNKLERGGFGHLWDSIIASNEVGVQKPDPKIYHLVLKQLGINPCQAIFVGHKSTELEGAAHAGLKTVAFNYDRGARADFYIENFSELAQLPILS